MIVSVASSTSEPGKAAHGVSQNAGVRSTTIPREELGISGMGFMLAAQSARVLLPPRSDCCKSTSSDLPISACHFRGMMVARVRYTVYQAASDGWYFGICIDCGVKSRATSSWRQWRSRFGGVRKTNIVSRAAQGLLSYRFLILIALLS